MEWREEGHPEKVERGAGVDSGLHPSLVGLLLLTAWNFGLSV